MMRVGLIGTGGAGSKRAKAIVSDGRTRLVAICDRDRAASQQLASETGDCTIRDSWMEIADDAEIDIIVVSTTHDSLSEISRHALRQGKHVLCEKPLGRHPSEVHRTVEAAQESGRCLGAGYNHRFHPAIARVRQAVLEGDIGPIQFIRGRYGHGGRPGYDREWRADPARSGGGELLDQGVHLIDLCMWLMDPVRTVSGCTTTSHWDIAPLEDNAFGVLQSESGQIASIHASWTQWKNLFCFEVFGRDGYGIAEGLGGSYGPESAVIGRRNEQGGAPSEERFEFRGDDLSWQLEWGDFLHRIESTAGSSDCIGATGSDALATIQWAFRLYEAAREQRAISVEDPP